MERREAPWRPPPIARARLALVGNMASDPPHDDDDFGKRIESHRDRLYRKAMRLSGNSDIAKDLVQETLFRALRRRAQFRPGTHLETWLVTILTHVFFDQKKHQKVERKAEPDLRVPEAVERDPTIVTISDAALEAAVQSLEPELRAVVELCYLQQMRYREAAVILGVPSGTVATRLMRARFRLRELLTTASEDVVKP